ncbi:hypothetical protein FJY93_03425 [Candidatus Kaiserbacteria bacterium]|nr:hypothetical protein [Candidatus Kaiserbacteria bacterium]
MTQIITHRGLDPSIPDFPFESTREAFEAHLLRGYGIEFDPQRVADGYTVLHDPTLKRITGGTDERPVRDVPLHELLTLDLHGSHLATMHDVLKLVDARSAPSMISAIHLKHSFQADTENLNALLHELHTVDSEKFILFDTTIATARYLKSQNSALHIAPSVAHPYDIARYNTVVGGTLISVDETLSHRDLFDWVWLDEWDLNDKDGNTKKLYTGETFEIFRTAGMKIALVTPELHGTSPGLLGGEAHPDAASRDTLLKRLDEIIALKPDAICTDFPDHAKDLITP